MRGHRDLEILCGGAALCALAALAIPLSALSVLFAVPLALFAPGYGITAATFARRSLGAAQIALLSVALSLITLVLGAFLLNYVPGGLGALSWALLLLIVVFGSCRFAALARKAPKPRRELLRIALGRREAALILAGVLLAALAVGLAMRTLPAKNADGYTELWVSPDALSQRAEIGVGSEEQHAASYLLQVRLGAGGQPLVRRFTLRPGETRRLGFKAPPAPSSAPLAVSARLFLSARPARVYRRVSAWIPAPPVPR